MSARRRTGFTLIEVLVALGLLGVLGAAVSGALVAGLRLQAEAVRTAERTRLLAPYAVPAGPPVDALPACDEVASDAAATVCVRGASRCRVAAATLACGGEGTLRRIELAVVGGAVPRQSLVVWRRAP